MMKRTFLLSTIALTSVLGLVGCGSSGADASDEGAVTLESLISKQKLQKKWMIL